MAVFAGMKGHYAYLSEQDAEGILWYFLLSLSTSMNISYSQCPEPAPSLLKNFKPSHKGSTSRYETFLDLSGHTKFFLLL